MDEMEKFFRNMAKMVSFEMVLVFLAIVAGVVLEYVTYATGHFRDKLTFLEFLTMDKHLFMR